MTTLNTSGEHILPGYEWISFASIQLALKWRKRNHRLRTVYDFDASEAPATNPPASPEPR